MPSHFKVKEYCPLVFRNLRERFSIDDQEYKESMTRWEIYTFRQPFIPDVSVVVVVVVVVVVRKETIQILVILEDSEVHKLLIGTFPIVGKTSLRR